MREMKDSRIEWIKTIPSNWSVKRGKAILTLKKRPPDEYGVDQVITCFRDGEVTLRKNRREEGFTFSDKEIGYQGIHKGDLVIHGMDGFAGSIGISDSDGKASPVLVVCDSKENKRFLMFYLRMLAAQNVFLALATGIRERSCDLRWNKIAELLFPIPSREEQLKIVNYLDSKCSLIDSIISKQEAIIEKLKEYKLSVITEAVTKGLNPNVEMKDSGVEWIGKVPNNFRVSTFKRFCFVNQGLQIAQSDRMTEPGENRYVYITVKFLNETDKEHSIEYIENPPKSTICCRDDILLARTGATGLVITGVEGCFHNNFFRINYNKQMLIHDYLVFYLMQDSIKQYLLLMAGTTTIPDLNHGDFYSTPLVVPPLEDQIEIVTYLKDKIDKIDKMIQKRQILITRLREYKKDLIYEVVTGKKEV